MASMQIARNILAFMIAIFIAVPACCCLAAAPHTPAAEHHTCCGEHGNQREGKEKQETVCNCSTAKYQKVADSDTPVPPIVLEPVLNSYGSEVAWLPPTSEFPTARAVEYPDPPRQLLVKLQRFLI